MSDFEKVSTAIDILENAEVMQEFDDCVWIKISKEDWDWLKSLEEVCDEWHE